MKDIIEIINQANVNGIYLSLRDENILIRYSSEKKLSDSILREIVERKLEILDYLKNLEFENFISGAVGKVFGNRIIYPVTSEQIWWIDDVRDVEFKSRLHGRILLSVFGEFNLSIFENATRELLIRHESLRSAFIKIDGEYYLYLRDRDDEGYGVDFQEFDDRSCEEFIGYQNHKFDIFNGPLICFRIAKTKNEVFFLSIRIHHVIFDAWSKNVLLRDLAVLYNSIFANTQPVLPILKFQYKDYLTYRCGEIRRNSDRERRYWINLLSDSFPEELVIPCGISALGNEDSYSTLSLKIDQTCVMKLAALAKAQATSIFVVLQSFFRSYFFGTTGNGAILLGTQVFGRGMHDSNEHQVGFYARTQLMLTRLDTNSNIFDSIEKTKKSNYEMNEYVNFTLKDTIEEIFSKSPHVMDSIWKINVQYHDENGYLADDDKDKKLFESNLVVKEVYHVESQVVEKIDLKLDFFKIQNEILMKVTYKNNIYDLNKMTNFFKNYLLYITPKLMNIV